MYEKNESNQSQLQRLIAKGKEQGFLTYAEVNDHLPRDIVDAEQVEEIIHMINAFGVKVIEDKQDRDYLLMTMTDAPTTDVDVGDAEAELVSVESELGRTTDPVRLYMREMGTVELLTRQGEIEIAKRIEEGKKEVMYALSMHSNIIDDFLSLYEEKISQDESRIDELITGFIDETPMTRTTATSKQVKLITEEDNE